MNRSRRISTAIKFALLPLLGLSQAYATTGKPILPEAPLAESRYWSLLLLEDKAVCLDVQGGGFRCIPLEEGNDATYAAPANVQYEHVATVKISDYQTLAVRFLDAFLEARQDRLCNEGNNYFCVNDTSLAEKEVEAAELDLFVGLMLLHYGPHGLGAGKDAALSGRASAASLLVGESKNRLETKSFSAAGSLLKAAKKVAKVAQEVAPKLDDIEAAVDDFERTYEALAPILRHRVKYSIQSKMTNVRAQLDDLITEAEHGADQLLERAANVCDSVIAWWDSIDYN
jgi:hypothetical protein